MKLLTALDEANQITVQNLIREYLSPEVGASRTVEGAFVEIQRVGNRFGVPRDAITILYEITHPELEFGLTARAVWRDGTLMSPLAVHCIVLDYESHGAHGSDYALRCAANDWLQSLPV
ncbi:hypothetical protein GU700_08490 [Methylobacterium sp. NI91]|nr:MULTISPECIES: hypothetical protein [unclassified Methylobacterium]QIJ74612.1 hypothetical protein CLZ_08490 [Methylobacterium sp. CLZ]QIJ79517.1 hypothetical protein GU700_08490 [Methylobacterium sp. NI91]